MVECKNSLGDISNKMAPSNGNNENGTSNNEPNPSVQILLGDNDSGISGPSARGRMAKWSKKNALIFLVFSVSIASIAFIINSTCQICPPRWHLKKDKCYQFQTKNTLKSWTDSQDDCSAKNAQLMEIQDMEDLDLVTENMPDMHYTYWIGLFWSLPMKKWKWATGSQVNHAVFKEQKLLEEKYCGAIKNKKIVSEICSTVFRRICQKDPIFI